MSLKRFEAALESNPSDLPTLLECGKVCGKGTGKGRERFLVFLTFFFFEGLFAVRKECKSRGFLSSCLQYTPQLSFGNSPLCPLFASNST